MTSSYQALSIVNMLLFGFTMAGVLVCVWIGWLRTRQIGFLVLGAWCLFSMAGAAVNYLPWIQSWLGRTVSSQATYRLMMWINLLRTIVSSLLLLVGMGLLVFTRPRPGPGVELQN